MGIDEQTIGQVLDWLARDRDPAWVALQDLAQRRVRSLARRWRLQQSDAEDVGDAVFLRVIDGDCAALRRSDASTPIAAWLTGIAKNVLRERGREEARRRAGPLNESEHSASSVSDESETSVEVPSARALPLDHLTPSQRAVVARLADGMSECRVATALGVTRNRVHDIKRRAIARLRKREPWEPPRDTSDRSWAHSAARESEAAGERTTARLLAMYADGATRAAIAAATGLSMVAVKQRIHRRRPRR